MAYAFNTSMANNKRRENSVTRSKHPLNETYNKEQADPIAAELPTRQEIYNWVKKEELDKGEKLARCIIYILTAGLVSCPADQHKDQDASHLATCRRYLHLRETWAGSSSRTGPSDPLMVQLRASVATSYRQPAGLRPNSQAGMKTKTGQMPRSACTKTTCRSGSWRPPFTTLTASYMSRKTRAA
ncbi:uncharacterized protein FRV6_16976 [Fusarium oxysporum]|uniref:Uncharacterized protein n=1 Tax=Fusarium oxysporum TaxID=5507 RepID=A0A2H3TW67_FUSOX|nr:uncharacterized protein FRV6_16976 [Fusarium oxysporum]